MGVHNHRSNNNIPRGILVRDLLEAMAKVRPTQTAHQIPILEEKPREGPVVAVMAVVVNHPEMEMTAVPLVLTLQHHIQAEQIN